MARPDIEAKIDNLKFSVYGLYDTRRAMAQLAPELKKALDNEMRDGGNRLRDDARRRVPQQSPMSGWRTNAPAQARRGWGADGKQKASGAISRGGAGWPAWNPAQVNAGIKTRIGQGRKRGDITSAAVQVRNESAAGVIFELAGRNSTGKSPQGIQFIRNLDRYDAASRLIWQAFDNIGKGIEADIKSHIERRTREFQRFLDTETREAA